MEEVSINFATLESVANNLVNYEWCPGNGTRYTIMVSKLKSGTVSSSCLGEVSDGWLVICGLTRTAYMLSAHGHLVDGYVAEKFNLRSEEDIKYVSALIRYATGRP